MIAATPASKKKDLIKVVEPSGMTLGQLHTLVEYEPTTQTPLQTVASDLAAVLKQRVLLTRGEETAESTPAEEKDVLAEWLAKGDGYLTQLPASQRFTTAPDAVPLVLLSGAFNPLHEGHRLLLEAARKMVSWDARAGYEISVLNADKGIIADRELRQRLRQFHHDRPVTLTRAPLFTEKALLLPGRIFVIGVDTLLRLIDVRYYANDEAKMREALQTIEKTGCRFLVAGRKDQRVTNQNEAPFLTRDDVSIPLGLESLFGVIPERLFRVDIRSTDLRAALQ
ncbi:hypothetical protein CCYA_CCYA03G1078 [Cyanidiococcus yangmingshanensis]|nr:hypothetical protein CCYA_CCYA03G1078 [Cyanidiococcus yangmingshanensis]